jgi:hypothetical protein
MAMGLRGRLSGWAVDGVLHLVPSEAKACRQALLPWGPQADLVVCLDLWTVLLSAECVAAVLIAAAAVGVGAVMSAWELFVAAAVCPALLPLC